MTFHASGDFALYFGLDADANDLAVGGWSMGANKYKIWHQGNDGSGSGLDADTLDGVQASSFLRSDSADTKNSGHLTFNDNVKAQFGGSGDLQIYHDASTSRIDNLAGHLVIKNTVDDHDIVLSTDDGSGGNVTYVSCDGSTGSVRLNHYGTEKAYTKSDGFDVVGELQCDSLDVDGDINLDGGAITFSASSNTLDFADSVKANFGNSDDLQIYHDGSHSYIKDGGTGNLKVLSSIFVVKNAADNETMLQATQNGTVDLYYDNSVKLNTTSSGIDVSGIVDIDSHVRHNGDGNTYFGFNGNDQINFYTNGSERFKIDSNGHMYFGQSATSIPGLGNQTTGASFEKLSSGGAFFSSRSDGPGLFVNRNNNGDVIQFYRQGSGKGSISVSSSGSNFNNGSDYRLKENIIDLTGAITRLKQLQPKQFNFIADAGVTQDGFIAHEAATVLPWAVTGTHNQIRLWGDYETDELPEGVSVGDPKLDDDGNTIPVMQGMDYGKVTPLLTAALQEAIAKIETLETQNADLLARVTALEGS